MKKKKLLIMLTTALTFVALTAALGGCAPQQASSDSKAETSSSESAPQGSLMAVHMAGQLDKMTEFPNKLCLSCHDRETINAANEDYSGIVGFNPHKAHLAAGDCITCHSVDATSTLSCNSCHDAPLPDGWQSAERGSGPIHELKQG